MKKFIAFAAVALLAASCAPKTAEEAAHAFHHLGNIPSPTNLPLIHSEKPPNQKWPKR